jgi:hypothetical protein
LKPCANAGDALLVHRKPAMHGARIARVRL